MLRFIFFFFIFIIFYFLAMSLGVMADNPFATKVNFYFKIIKLEYGGGVGPTIGDLRSKTIHTSLTTWRRKKILWSILQRDKFYTQTHFFYVFNKKIHFFIKFVNLSIS